MKTLTYTGELIVASCWCGIQIAIPLSLYNEAQRKKAGCPLYCPLGHTFIFGGDPEAAELRRDLQWERDRRAAVEADRDQISASLRTIKGVVTKLRKRAITGTCAFCHRHFANVERHVATKHPSETPETVS